MITKIIIIWIALVIAIILERCLDIYLESDINERNDKK